MLSTSNKTKFQYQYLLIAVVLLAMISVIALYQTGILPAISTGQQTSAAIDLSWPPRPDFSHLNQQALIPVTGSADGLAVYHSSEWAAPVTVQKSLAKYFASERGTFAATQNGMSIYHQSERNAAQVPALHNFESARWMGAALASQAQVTEQQIRDVESVRWMGAALASQTQVTSFHYTSPGR